MANISASLVKELRDKTGAGMMDCKSALAETNGNLDTAIDWLRKKGLSKAAKKAGRVAAEGLIGVASGGRGGAPPGRGLKRRSSPPWESGLPCPSLPPRLRH